jgi:serine/threonine protein kinase
MSQPTNGNLNFLEPIKLTIKEEPNNDNEKKYIILRTLGKGSFGKVKEALHVKSGEKIAIKILEKARI